ncbi:hypothetical protein BDN72DRAFT_881223 [Pluteus cervinus]|uniref:Uncharacterized protein n=1 Tax=Pluteus cervinus TaxID=181527 RepID=A0ACD3AHB0_9AGAR|nr:hypothetical protein BDN72DRAFT_881223 [Pluteus cervinus]
MSGVDPPNHEEDRYYEEPSTSPPISCLPPELLIRIFFTFQSLHDAGNFYQWTSILQISQSWRDLVLGTSSLWGGIMQVYSDRLLHWAVVSLERSGSAKLDVNIYMEHSTESICNFILEVLSQIHRIRSLKLTIGAWFGSFDAPKQLRLLHLLESPAPSLEEMFDFIGPDLKALQLQNIFDPASDASPTSRLGRFQFEKLKSIKLLGELEARLFDFVTLPPCLVIESRASGRAALNLVPSLISSRNIEKWPVDYLEIKVENRHVCLRIAEDWSKTDEPMTSAGPDGTQTHVQLDITGVDDHLQLLPVFNLLPIHPIEKVSFVGGYLELQSTIILDYLAGLITVRELGIELPFLTTFLASTTVQVGKLQLLVDEGVLEEPDDVRDTEKRHLAQEIISFHGLQDLKVYGDQQESTKLTSQDARTLQTWLEWRKRCDLRLERLSLSRLITPPISWLTGVFDGLVGEFQTNDLTEIEDSNPGSGLTQMA